VLLLEPQETAYDWHFQIAGIPVRVHPGFWLLALMLFAREGMSELLVGTLAVLVSLLVHELGHALTMQYFGERARVVLYMMGGLAIPQSSAWSLGYQRRAYNAWAQVLISAAGPGAGFLLAGAAIALVLAGGGQVSYFLVGHVLPVVDVDLPGRLQESPYAQMFVTQLLWFTIFWGFVNLVPVFPLDGGQIARELLVRQDPWQGTHRALWLSVAAGVVMAAFGWFVMHDAYIAILFGLLAVSNLQALQQSGGGGW
jgi:Zn-dependent protease